MEALPCLAERTVSVDGPILFFPGTCAANRLAADAGRPLSAHASRRPQTTRAEAPTEETGFPLMPARLCAGDGLEHERDDILDLGARKTSAVGGHSEAALCDLFQEPLVIGCPTVERWSDRAGCGRGQQPVAVPASGRREDGCSGARIALRDGRRSRQLDGWRRRIAPQCVAWRRALVGARHEEDNDGDGSDQCSRRDAGQHQPVAPPSRDRWRGSFERPRPHYPPLIAAPSWGAWWLVVAPTGGGWWGSSAMPRLDAFGDPSAKAGASWGSSAVPRSPIMFVRWLRDADSHGELM